jgi:hypothetical protein
VRATLSAISGKAIITIRIGRSKAGGTEAALNCWVWKERLRPRISRQCVRASTHKRENSYDNVTGQIIVRQPHSQTIDQSRVAVSLLSSKRLLPQASVQNRGGNEARAQAATGAEAKDAGGKETTAGSAEASGVSRKRPLNGV